MIRLDVNYICHGCPDFEPELRTLYSGSEPYEQRVVCANQRRCERIELRIRREIQKEKENEN